MKEILLEYAACNVWANKLMITAMLKMDAGLTEKELVSSFPTIRATVLHTWSAEYIWLQRLQLAERPEWVAGAYAGTFEEACNNWIQVSGALQEFVHKQYDDRALQHVLQYYDLKKVSHKTPVYQVLQHVFNHSTYHRGQLVTMMRECGVTEIPQTDLILYARGGKK